MPVADTAEPSSAKVRSDGPILIIGTERSGSNLLRLILNQHSRVVVPHPPHFMRYLAPITPAYGDLTDEENRRTLVRDVLTLARRHIHPWEHHIDQETVVRTSGPTLFGVVAAVYEQYRLAEGKARWGCKSTFTVHHVAEVLAERPDARFLWLVRDPRDVAASSKRSVFNPFHPYLTARLWETQQRIALAERERRGPGVVHLIRYEDLVSAPRATLERMCDFIGEPLEPAMLSHDHSPTARRIAALSESWRNTAQPITTASVGRHVSGLSAGERAQVEAATQPLLSRLGYPPSGMSSPATPPSPRVVRLQDALLRCGVELRSMWHDRNYIRRVLRDGTVRWLRVKAFSRSYARAAGRAAAGGPAAGSSRKELA
jgi:hypothetical protein